MNHKPVQEAVVLSLEVVIGLCYQLNGTYCPCIVLRRCRGVEAKCILSYCVKYDKYTFHSNVTMVMGMEIEIGLFAYCFQI
jgi:hypothetical protein